MLLAGGSGDPHPPEDDEAWRRKRRLKKKLDRFQGWLWILLAALLAVITTYLGMVRVNERTHPREGGSVVLPE
jgi:hypothetical protein